VARSRNRISAVRTVPTDDSSTDAERRRPSDRSVIAQYIASCST